MCIYCGEVLGCHPYCPVNGKPINNLHTIYCDECGKKLMNVGMCSCRREKYEWAGPIPRNRWVNFPT